MTLQEQNAEKIKELDPNVQWAATALLADAGGKGITAIIREAHRSYRNQVIAWERYLRGEIAAAAPPGKSLHQIGLAADISVPSNRLDEFVRIAEKYGIERPLPKRDPYHFEFNHVCPVQGPPPFGGYPTAEAQEKAILRALEKPQPILRKNMLQRLLARLRKLL